MVDVDGEVAAVTIEGGVVGLVDPPGLVDSPGLEVSACDGGWVVEVGSE